MNKQLLDRTNDLHVNKQCWLKLTRFSFTYLDVLPDGIDDNWPGLRVNSHETSQSRIKFILRRLKKKKKEK